MSFTLGVFDVFTYTATGATYLACLAYVLDRLNWVSMSELADVNSTVLVLGLILLSYLVGQMAYPLGYFADKLFPGIRVIGRYLRTHEEFAERIPGDRAKRLAELDTFVLLGALEIYAREASQEVNRLRAAGLAVRSAAPALTVAALIADVEIFTGDQPLFAGACAVFFTLCASAAILRSRQLRDWTILKTLQLAYWVRDIEPVRTVDERR